MRARELFFGCDDDNHAFSLKFGHGFGFADFLKVVAEARQQQFALLFEEDAPSAEEHIGLHLVAVGEELACMLELEVIVVLIGLRPEPYLLDFHLLGVLFLLFLLAFFLVEELLIVNYPANGRVGSGGYLHQIKVLYVSNTHGLFIGINSLLDIVADEAHLSHAADFVVNPVRQFFFYAAASANGGLLWICYSFVLLTGILRPPF